MKYEKTSKDEKTSKHYSTDHSFGDVNMVNLLALHVQLWWSVVLFHGPELGVDHEFDSQHSRNLSLHTPV